MVQEPPSSLTKTQAAFHRIREAIEDGNLRAAANRLRSAARSAVPTIMGPASSNEPTYDDDHLPGLEPPSSFSQYKTRAWVAVKFLSLSVQLLYEMIARLPLQERGHNLLARERRRL
jgi:hypothetical protein